MRKDNTTSGHVENEIIIDIDGDSEGLVGFTDTDEEESTELNSNSNHVIDDPNGIIITMDDEDEDDTLSSDQSIESDEDLLEATRAVREPFESVLEFSDDAEMPSDPIEMLRYIAERIPDVVEEEHASRIAAYPESIQLQIKAYELGVDPSTVLNSYQNAIQWSQVDIADVDSNDQKALSIIEASLRASGTQEKVIGSIAKSILASEDRADVVAEMRNGLVEHEKASALQVLKEQAIAQEQERIRIEENQKLYRTNVSSTISSREEIVPGIKLTPKTKEMLFDSLTLPYQQDSNGRYISYIEAKKNENPIAFDMTLSYLISLGVFDGKFDALEKAFQSKFTKKVTNSLSSSSIVSAKQSAVADNRSTAQIIKTHLKKNKNKQ